MKYLLPVICVFLFSGKIFAQFGNYNFVSYYSYELANFHLLEPQKIADLQISHVKCYRIDKSKAKDTQPSLVAEYGFNSYGKITFFVEYDKSGKENLRNSSTYNNDSLLIEFIQKGQKKYQNYRITYEYNQYKSFVVLNKYNSKFSEPVYSIYRYFDGNKVIKAEYFEKGKLDYFITYSYYPDGSNEKNQRYNKKGKLVRTTSFACKPVGEVTKPAKDTVRICKYEKYDNSGKIYKITETTNEKNKVIKHIEVYNADTVLIESSSYKDDTVLYYRTVYLTQSAKNKTPVISEHYFYRKGKLTNTYKYLFDNQFRQISMESIDYKGSKTKVNYSKTNQFNEQGLMVKCNSIDKKGKHFEFTYDYTFR